MPDNEDIYTRSAMTVQWLSGKQISVIEVNAWNTSQSHHLNCLTIPKGKIQRSSLHYDLAPCSACGNMVNTHHNAACVIRNRGLDYIAYVSALGQDPP